MFSLRTALICLASLALVAAVPAAKRQDAGPHTGRASFYQVGLGVCGFANPSDFVVALSPGVFDAFPHAPVPFFVRGWTDACLSGATPGDPSHNPICGRQATVTYNGKSITVTISDRCISCAFNDIDLSTNAFQALAGGLNVGFVDVTWEIVGL